MDLLATASLQRSRPMRHFIAISCLLLLLAALFPITMVSAFMLGLKAAFHIVSLIVNDPKNWKVTSGSPPPAGTDILPLDGLIPNEVFHASLAILMLSVLLFAGYFALTVFVVRRKFRPALLLGMGAAACHLYFFSICLKYGRDASVTLNHQLAPNLIAYPLISLVLVGVLVALSRYRFRSEPPPLGAAGQRAAAAGTENGSGEDRTGF